MNGQRRCDADMPRVSGQNPGQASLALSVHRYIQRMHIGTKWYVCAVPADMYVRVLLLMPRRRGGCGDGAQLVSRDAARESGQPMIKVVRI